MHEVDFFEHAESISSARADRFLKWIDPDYYIADTGHVESPMGHVALVQITPDMIANYVTSEGDPWMSQRINFAPGWFLIKTNSDGLVWGMEYGGFCDMHQAFCADSFEEMKVRHDFAVVERQYAEWDAEVNGDREPEKLYLVGACGEAFDDMQVAFDHVEQPGACDDCLSAGGSFHVVPESEAM
jgi:hypothetical protein